MKKEESVITFLEHPVVSCITKEPHEFDICIKTHETYLPNGTLCMKFYNEALVNKIVLLPKIKLEEFFKHQLQHIKHPAVWLFSLDALLNSILEQVPEQKETIKLLQALAVIGKIEASSTKTNTPLQFDFDNVLSEITMLKSEPEKLVCLINWKTRFLQNKPIYNYPNQIPFDQQIDLEIDRIKQIRELTNDSVNPHTGSIKLRWNGQVNVLADIFFQFSTIRTNGKPLIDCPIPVLTEFMIQSFVDKDGQQLSAETLKTILRPNRYDKRPKDGRIEISDLLEK